MTSAEDDMREFFATAPLDVPSRAVSVGAVVATVRRRRRRWTAAAAVAGTGVVAMIGVSAVMAAGLSDGAVAPAVVPEKPGIHDIDHLNVITPTDVGGLAIGMTVSDVEDLDGVEVTVLAPTAECAALLTVGDTVRGYLEPWPTRHGEMVVTALMYYGNDARTTTGIAVGRPFDPEQYRRLETVDTPLGAGTTAIGYGQNGLEHGPISVGYQVVGSCHVGSDVGSAP